jgi:hypothetical protein
LPAASCAQKIANDVKRLKVTPPATPHHLQRNEQYLPFGPWPTGADTGRVTPRDTGKWPKPTYKNAQTDLAGDVLTLIEEDVSNVLGKSNLVCEAKLVDTRRPRSESSLSFPARLAVTSQSAASQPLQGSRSPARASRYNQWLYSWSRKTNRPSSSEPFNYLLGCHPAQSTSRPFNFRRQPRQPCTIGKCYERRGTTCRDCYWSSRSQ